MSNRWGVKADSISSLPENAAPYTHSLCVQTPSQHGAFGEGYDVGGKIRQEVLDWCSTNCQMPAMVCGYELVCFQNEDDAMLFYFTFKR
jgi:hypothetical protein